MASPKTNRRKRIWKKTGGVCAHCGRRASSVNQTIDHFIPRVDYGGYDQRNLVPLCKECNKKRGSDVIDPKEFYSFAPDWVINECIAYKNEHMERKGGF